MFYSVIERFLSVILKLVCIFIKDHRLRFMMYCLLMKLIRTATEAQYLFDDVILLLCYMWNRSVIVPKEHLYARDPMFNY